MTFVVEPAWPLQNVRWRRKPDRVRIIIIGEREKKPKIWLDYKNINLNNVIDNWINFYDRVVQQ